MTVKNPTFLKNPFVSIDGHDFSQYVKNVTINRQKDELDTTASGDNAHSQIPGLSKDSITLNMLQDADLSIVDRVLADIYEAGLAVVVECAMAGSTISEANPSFTANARLYNYVPFQGDVGTVVMMSPQFMCDGPIVRSGT